MDIDKREKWKIKCIEGVISLIFLTTQHRLAGRKVKMGKKIVKLK